MSGRQEKKIRKEIAKMKQELAQEEIIRFRLWVRQLTFRQRMKLAWKVMRNRI